MKKYYYYSIAILTTFVVVFYLIFYKVFLHVDDYSFRAKVQEPSGLTFAADYRSLWTVSDQTGKLYNFDFLGNTINTIDIKANNLEGITTLNDSLFAVVDEADSKILFVSIDGSVINERKIPIENAKNSGLEGIAYDSYRKQFYLLKESKPGILYTLDEQLEIISETKLDFAKDYSGLYYDDATDNLWIISDENKLIARCNIYGDVIKSIETDFIKLEGIAVNDSLVYVISDRTSTVFFMDKKIFFKP